MEWFEYPYPRPDLMNKWHLARHSEVMGEKFETEASKEKFDKEVQTLFKSFRSGEPHADLCSLFECLYAAAKMEEREDPACKERPSFTKLYSEGLHSLLENYIHDPPCWKRAPNENEIVLYCMALTADLAKRVLKSLHIATNDMDPPQRINNAIAIVRSLITVYDKDSLFHELNKHRPLPPWILFHPRQYTKARFIFPTKSPPRQDQSCDYLDSKTHASSNHREDPYSGSCGYDRCSTSPQESYVWMNILLEHFGRGSGIAGFDVFLDTLVKISLLETTRSDILELCELILQFLSNVMEFLKEEATAALLKPCLGLQATISRWHGTKHQLVIDENLLGTMTLIAHHFRFIFGSLLPSGVAQAVLGNANKSLRDLLIGFESSEVDSATASSSPRAVIGGGTTERHHHVPTIDSTTARAIKEEVSRQMRQQLTEFVSEFVSELLAMLMPTLQPGSVMKIKQQPGADGVQETTNHCEIAYPNSSSLTMIETTIKTAADRVSELSPPRSSAALGATMRDPTEIVFEGKLASRCPPSECCPVEFDGSDFSFVPGPAISRNNSQSTVRPRSPPVLV